MIFKKSQENFSISILLKLNQLNQVLQKNKFNILFF